MPKKRKAKKAREDVPPAQATERFRNLMLLPLGLQDSSRIHVIYHYPCYDGAFAALAVHLFLRLLRRRHRPRVFWWPVQVWQPAEQQVLLEQFRSADVVFVLDFFGSAAFVDALCQRTEKVYVLDHHETMRSALLEDASVQRENLEVIFDVERSGAVIAYDFFAERVAQVQAILNSSDSGTEHTCDTDAVDAIAPDTGDDGEIKDIETAEVDTVATDNRNDNKDTERNKVSLKLCSPRVRRLFLLVQDNDLFRENRNRDFQRGLGVLRIELSAAKNAEMFSQLKRLDSNKLCSIGERLAAQERVQLTRELQQCFILHLPCKDEDERRVLAVHTDRPSLRSQTGHALAERGRSLGYSCVR
ncbi:MAG: hypothetical protein MHM6MM_001556 [Cercozoa sp. M6MM]